MPLFLLHMYLLTAQEATDLSSLWINLKLDLYFIKTDQYASLSQTRVVLVSVFIGSFCILQGCICLAFQSKVWTPYHSSGLGRPHTVIPKYQGIAFFLSPIYLPSDFPLFKRDVFSGFNLFFPASAAAFGLRRYESSKSEPGIRFDPRGIHRERTRGLLPNGTRGLGSRTSIHVLDSPWGFARSNDGFSTVLDQYLFAM